MPSEDKFHPLYPSNIFDNCVSNSSSVSTTFFTPTPKLPPDTAGFTIKGLPNFSIISLALILLSLMASHFGVATPASSKAFFMGILEVVIS